MVRKIINILFFIVSAYFILMLIILPIAMYNNGEELYMIRDVMIIIVVMYTILFLLPYLEIRKQLKTVIEKKQTITQNIAIHSINIRNIAFQLAFLFFMALALGVSQDARSGFESLLLFLVIISIPIVLVNLNLMYKAYQVQNTNLVLFSIIYLLIQIAILIFPFFWIS